MTSSLPLCLKESLLRGNAIYLLDGGVSSLLQEKLGQQHEAPVTECYRYPELWSSSLLLDAAGRQLIYEGHCDWIHAGSDIVTTVTYQCHYEERLWPKPAIVVQDGDCQDSCRTKEPMTRSRISAMFRQAVKLARTAVADTRNTSSPSNSTRTGTAMLKVVVSLGPFAGALGNGAEYTGDYGDTFTLQDMVRFHQDRIEAVLELNPDGIALETIPSLMECQALSIVLRNGSSLSKQLADSNVACWISLSCRDGSHLNDGTPLQDALRVLTPIPSIVVQGFGFNCCHCEYLTELCRTMMNNNAKNLYLGAHRALLLYPNSGETFDATVDRYKDGTGSRGDDFAEKLIQTVRDIQTDWSEKLTTMPTIVIGGCCRTLPSAILALRAWIDCESKLKCKQLPRSP